MTTNRPPMPEREKHRERHGSACPRSRLWRRWAAAGFAAVLCLAASVEASAQRRMYDGWEGGPYMMPWNMGWIGSLLMFALWVAFIIAVLVFIKRWIQTPRNGNQTPAPRPSAMDILKERYARGEIDKQEFEEKKRVLQENP